MHTQRGCHLLQRNALTRILQTVRSVVLDTGSLLPQVGGFRNQPRGSGPIQVLICGRTPGEGGGASTVDRKCRYDLSAETMGGGGFGNEILSFSGLGLFAFSSELRFVLDSKARQQIARQFSAPFLLPTNGL